MKKRILALLLVLCLTTGMIPVVSAKTVASGTCGENLTWTLSDDGVLTISGTGPMKDYSSVYAPWDSSNKSIKSVIIEDGVTTISSYAFEWCTNLTSVEIPDSVTTIGECAFVNCSSLSSVEIPHSVTTIGDWAFNFCDSLSGIYVDANNPIFSSDDSGVLFDKLKTNLIQAPGAIYGSYTIPDSVTIIGDDAFYRCNSLSSVVIGNSVTTIGDWAFYGCDSLNSVVIPNGVDTIGSWAFADCKILSSVVIGNSVTIIGVVAFSGCDSLSRIYVDVNNPSFSNDDCGVLFDKNKTNLVQAPGAICGSYTIPDNVTTISSSAFFDCHNLCGVVIPDSVTTIDGFAFYNCENLSSVIIGNSVTTIGEDAFYNCTSLTDVYYRGTEEQWIRITIGSGNECLSDATIHFESKVPSDPTIGYQMHAYGSCRDGSISRGEEMTIVVELCKDGIPVSDWNTPVYTIDDHSIISVTKSEKKGDYVYLTVRGVREGKTILTVTDSYSSAYVALEIEVRNSDAIPSCFFITNVPRFYPDQLCERNNLTNFYNFNGLYVCDFPLPNDIKKVNGEYTITFTVYNSTHMYGSVDIFDAAGNWKGCERIDKHTEITGLWDTAKSAFFLIRDLVTTDLLSYNAASYSTPTKITVTIPEGGYITISNNFAESQGTYIYNTVDFLMLGVSLATDLATGEYEMKGVQEQAVNQILQTPDSYKTFMMYFPEVSDMISKDLTLETLGSIIESITYQSFELYDELNFDFFDAAANSIGDTATDIFAECTPSLIGMTLKGMFWTNAALDRVYQAMDMCNSEDKPYIVLYTPEAAGGLIMSGVTVTPDDNSVPDDAVLQVFRIGNTDAMVISDEGLVVSQYELYNICFTVNDREVQPNSMVTVKIPIPENFSDDKCIVFHQQDDGQWSKVDCWIENGFIVFAVDHFSQFALVDMSTAEPYICPFTDVTSSDYYYEPVLWALEEGITDGVTETEFAPEDTCKRSQVVTFLWRAAGEPKAASRNNPFVDVKSTDYFYEAVLWAVEKGITDGMDETHFEPDGVCNRSQVVTFLYRAFKEPPVGSASNPFTDVPANKWYATPVLWAVKEGITDGVTETSFAPEKPCTRGQVVTFLYRAYVD